MEESNKVVGTLQASETELVFWRSISKNNDPNEIELYLEEFPDGAFAKLARIKLAKIRGLESDEVNKNRLQRASQAQEERADLEAQRDATLKGRGESESSATKELEERKSKLEAELVEREQVYHRRIAEIDAQREEESKVFAEVKAREKATFESRHAKQEADIQLQLERRKEELEKHEEALGRKTTEAALLAIEVRKKRGSPLVPIGIALFVVTLGLGGFYSFSLAPEPDQNELVKMLEEMKNSNHEVMLAREKEQLLRKNIELARAAEMEAKASGDVARQKQLAEESRKQETELAKQVEEVKKREFEEKKLAEAQAKKKVELDNLAKQSDIDKKAAAEKATTDKAVADRVAAEKATADRVAAEKATADKAVADRVAAEKATADRVAAEKATADKAAAERLAIEKAVAAKAFADKSAIERAAASKREDEQRKAEQLAKSNVEVKTGSVLSSRNVGSQSWTYRAYRVVSGSHNIAIGVLTLEEVSGKAVVRFTLNFGGQFGSTDSCISQDLDATVKRSPAITFIEATPRLRGCPEYRFEIKNDGTGGQTFVRSGTEWIHDGQDHILTPRK